MRKWLFPVLAILCFIFESIFVQMIPTQIFEMEHILVPRFTIIIIIIITMFSKISTGMAYGFVLGLLYDLMYTNLIGVYMFAYTFLAYLVAIIMKALPINTLTLSIVSIFTISLLDFFVYGIQLLIKATQIPIDDFITIRLLPTLILNLTFVIIFYILLRKHFFLILDTNKDE